MDYKSEIAARLSEITGLTAEEIEAKIEIPPRLDMGDYAFPCFILAKAMRMAPPAIAAQVVTDDRLKIDDLRAENVGPYINFFIDLLPVQSSVRSSPKVRITVLLLKVKVRR